MDHSSETPITGNLVTEEIYDNENIAKCLYYGWGGKEQWSGFTSREMGIVCTSLALDYFNHPGSKHKNAQKFIDYIETVSMPNITLDFSKKNLTAYIAEDNTKQRTESVSLIGNSEYYLTLKLQDGVTLVNETKDISNTGIANIYGGDSFHFEASLDITGSWKSDKIENCTYKFQPLVYRTNGEYQDLAGDTIAIEDKATTTDLSINWISYGNLIIHKIDAEDNNIIVTDTVFDIFDSNNNVIKTVETDAEGIAKAENLKVGTYKIIEKSTNQYYNLNKNETIANVTSGDCNITISNKRKTGFIEINKFDAEDNSKKLSNTRFEIYDNQNNLLETLETDSNGYAKSEPLYFDKTYVVKEVYTREEYISKDEIWEVNLAENGINDGYVYTLNISNEHKKGDIYIEKITEDNKRIGLGNVEFELYYIEDNKKIKVRNILYRLKSEKSI